MLYLETPETVKIVDIVYNFINDVVSSVPESGAHPNHFLS